MSSQVGNSSRQRPQKHCNKRRFKNDLNDKSPRVQTMNTIDLKSWELCKKCIDVIQWKITYKKYKPLTQPRKCIKCEGKTVKRAYCVVCTKCADDKDICAKCLKNRQEDDNQMNSNKALSSKKTDLKKLPSSDKVDAKSCEDDSEKKVSDNDSKKYGESDDDDVDDNDDDDNKNGNSVGSHDDLDPFAA